MAVLLKFTVNRDSDVPEVQAHIEKFDYSEDDIEVKYARLAMRYLREMNEEKMIVDQVPEVKDLMAVIAFSSDGEEIDGLEIRDLMGDDNEDDTDFESWLHTESPDSGSMKIGFKMAVESIELIGGMATPAVKAATGIYNLLLEAREQVKA